MYFFIVFLFFIFYAIIVGKHKSHRSCKEKKKCLLFLLILNINERENSVPFRTSFFLFHFFQLLKLSAKMKISRFLCFSMTLNFSNFNSNASHTEYEQFFAFLSHFYRYKVFIISCYFLGICYESYGNMNLC
jgi:hypothetical protein